MSCRRGFDWLFRSRVDGRITVAQWPNLSLYLYIFAALLASVAPAGGAVARTAGFVAEASLLFWAADEVLRGVNPWRRCLGAGVIAWRLVVLLR